MRWRLGYLLVIIIESGTRKENKNMSSCYECLDKIQHNVNKYGKVKNLYGQMFEELELWIQAYANTYSNQGSMTPGVVNDTVDGKSLNEMKKIMNALRDERYYPKPVRRTYRDKKSGGRRPLGLPTYSDKLIQEVMRMQLSAIYEKLDKPIFHEYSHGFRPNRSCHTALKYIKNTFTGIKWFIEGDIEDCFGSINHDILLSLIEKRVDDGRYINLINKFLKAGYMEDWQYHNTFSGTPQGGVLSPLLANIYLQELDNFISFLMKKWNIKDERDVNREYRRLSGKMYRRRKKLRQSGKDRNDSVILELKKELNELEKIRKQLPRSNMYDRGYKRIRYCRYADDFLVGVIGTKKDAEKIKEVLAKFLKEKLDLDLSLRKTKITHSANQVKFLSYVISCTYERGDRDANTTGKVRLHLSKKVVRECRKEFSRNGKPIHLPQLTNLDDMEILLHYDAKLRGWYNYWKMAENVSDLHEVHYYAKESLMKTFATKYKSTKHEMYQKYYDNKRKQVRVKVEGRDKSYKMISKFKRDIKPRTDMEIDRLLNIYYFSDGVEIKRRIRGGRCELCERKTDNLIPHHVRRMADIRSDSEMSEWKKVMIGKYRKSLMVCKTCHDRIHRTTR